MLPRSRATLAFLPLLGFILGVSQLAGSRLLPPLAFAKQKAVTQAPAPADAPSETIYVIALDKDGQPIKDLTQEEIRILEDKVEQEITSVSAVGNEPLTIGLFFDVSGSRHADQSVGEEVKQTSDFVHSIWQEGDTGFVVTFSTDITVLTEPTRNLEEIDLGLGKIPQARYWGSTPLYDALCLLKPDRIKAIPGRKVYVALGDFDDNSSKNRQKNVVEFAHAAKVSIFSVILREGLERRGYWKVIEKRGRKNAQKIADETGAEVLVADSAIDLRAIFERIAGELRASYRVIYTPSLTGDRRKKKLYIETTRPQVTLLFPKKRS